MKNDSREGAFGQIIHVLREIPFFSEFTEDEMEFFSKNVSLRYFPEKTVLFSKEDIGDYLFFIVEGTVDIRLESQETKQIVVATLSEGSCVGEMSVIDEYPRSATVVVTNAAELLLLTRNRFDQICGKNPAVGIKFLRGLAKSLSSRLRKTTGRFADLA